MKEENGEMTALEALSELCGVPSGRRTTERGSGPELHSLGRKAYLKGLESVLKEKGLKKCISEKLDEIRMTCGATGCDFAGWILDRLTAVDDLLTVYDQIRDGQGEVQVSEKEGDGPEPFRE